MVGLLSKKLLPSTANAFLHQAWHVACVGVELPGVATEKTQVYTGSYLQDS